MLKKGRVMAIFDIFGTEKFVEILNEILIEVGRALLSMICKNVWPLAISKSG